MTLFVLLLTIINFFGTKPTGVTTGSCGCVHFSGTIAEREHFPH